MKIARVQPLARTRAVRGPFDYKLKPEHAEVEVGSVVRVPFARRSMLGVVVELAGESSVTPERLAEPEAVLEDRVPADLVELAMWMASEYCSTPARALALVLAPGAGARTPTRTRQTLEAAITASGLRALHGGAVLTARQRGLLEELERRGPILAAELGTTALRRLEARGLVEIEGRMWRPSPRRPAVGHAPADPLPLTGEQRGALDAVRAASANGRASPLLLHGVTGSGKTEIYLQAAQATLAASRSVIVLVPEIALTPQALARFTARFGDVVAVMHSGLSAAARRIQWRRLRDGEARICVGPRSAVFAPLSDLGLLIVDEEHESSYKHEGDPRYDARAVAERRARAHGALLLQGSATPRPESVIAGARVRLSRRIDARPLPGVEILDMRGRHHPLHPETRLALADLRRQRGKAVVLLNRRGWSNFLSCRACGRVWLCPHCDVALVLHRGGGRMACHHCGHQEPIPSRCPACASTAVARHGAGTERLEHELQGALGDASFPVLRLDADATGTRARAQVLERFAAADGGLLVGTQMVAKGHDFPDVALGVVLDADATLRFPDFRAEERTFALITQLAGRAGRAVSGRVLVQTRAPEARSISFAARHDADGFLAQELSRREALRYPPFASLIRIVCAAGEAAEAQALAGELRQRLDPPGASILGPAPLFRLRGRARSQIVVKAEQRTPAIASVGEAVDALASVASRRGVSVSVDVDPQ